jgi:hypothetical protein
MSTKVCPSCGEEHESPFHPDVLSLARKINQLEAGEERNALMMELADLHADEGDWSDLAIPEDLHALMETYLQARLEASAAGFRLSRLLLRAVGAYDHHQSLTEERNPSEPPDVKKTAGLN